MDVNGILSCAIGKVLSTNNLNRSGKQWCYGPRHTRDRRFCPCWKSIITVPPVRLAYGELLVLLFLRHLGFRRQLPSQGWILHNALNILKRFPKLRKKHTVTSWSAVHFVLANPKLSDFYIASWPPAMDTHQWSTPHSPPLGAGKCPPTGVTYNPICACCGYRCRDYINERIRRWRMRRRLNNHGGQRGAHWEINNGQYGMAQDLPVNPEIGRDMR